MIISENDDVEMIEERDPAVGGIDVEDEITDELDDATRLP